MSLVSETVSTTAQFQTVDTAVLNHAYLHDFAEGKDGDVLTWNKLTLSWEPQTPTAGTNVYVIDVDTNADFYPTFTETEHGSAPLNTNLQLKYNPGTNILTVPYIDSIVTHAVDSVNAANVEVSDNTGTNLNLYPTFVSGSTGNHNVQVDSTGLTYNPSTNTLSVANITGTVSTATNATQVTVTNDTTSNATFYVPFVPGIAGSQVVKVDSVSLLFNPFTNTLTVPNLAGNATSANNATNASQVTVTNNTVSPATFYPTFVADATTGQGVNIDKNSLTYNPLTNTLTVANVAGTASNAVNSTNADNVLVADTIATNAVMYPTFVSSNVNYNNVRVDSTNLTYNPFTDTLSSALFSGSLINVVTINGAPYPPPLPNRVPTGNTLTVDAVNGNDAIASTGTNRYSYYFKTISAALLLAVSGENVVVNAGTYNETLTIPTGVSLTGAGTQCVVIQQLSVAADTTLITVNPNVRLENFTANLTTSVAGVNLVGINFLGNSSINTKMRNSVWTVQSTATPVVGAGNVYGVLAAAASATTYTAANAIQRTTVNVISNTTGITRGIYVTGANWFAVRDIVVFARGDGTNIIGVEVNNVGAVCQIKTSTVAGIASDIFRNSGTMLLGFTDLRSNKANNPATSPVGNSFEVVTESNQLTFGISGNLNKATTYYLVPGTMQENQFTHMFADRLNIPVPQNMIMFAGTANFSGTLTAPQTLTFNLYYNLALVFSIQLDSTASIKTVSTVSVDMAVGTTYYATLVTSDVSGGGGFPSGIFTATIAFY